MKRTLLSAVAGLALLACGEQPAAAPLDPGAYRLYLRDYNTITVADAASGQVLSNFSAGVHTPDWSRVYTVSGSSSLVALDPVSGKKLAEVQLPGAYQFPFQSSPLAAVSPNGRWVALSRWDDQRGAPGIPASHFAVVDGERESVGRVVDLSGYWTVDALSNDGHWLYLIENLAAGRYRVRLYDLVAGALNPTVVADPHDGDAPMTGERMDSVASPDGAWIYSLYANANGSAFIHALPVGAGSTSAVCIDLPDIKSAGAMTLTMSPDGSRLYATDGNTALVQEIIPPGAGGPGKVARRLQVPPREAAFNPFVVDAEAAGPGDGTGPGMHSVLTSAGVLYFPLSAGIGAVDVKTWKVRGRYAGREVLRTLTLSPDGRWMYGVTDTNHLLRIDPGSGRLVQAINRGPWSLQLERADAAGR